ncbi:hypothetical protein AN217_12195 [Streptomyces qinglanensis]|uniref:Transferase n=1 Tax=Streptomyces qinglanensis TaxID=943816 RepID=A0A1E7K3F8_9ACTN|nr:hypothetical protein [Streptomyces qinglanensis]OEU98449.1 hypothetical protein AN217_12195 [Streptomyces qinglanensis]
MSGSTIRTVTTGAASVADGPLAPRPLGAEEEHRHDAGDPVPPQPAQRGPATDCTADSAGGLTFDLRLAGTEAGTGSEDAGLLLCRRPDASGETEEVRLPLTPVQDAEPGTLRAALPSTVRLTEGRWNVFLALAGRDPRRLSPGVNDLRSLVDRVPHENRGWLGVRIPYATKHGNLSVRAWMRWPHAEAGALRMRDGALEVGGRLYGAEVSATARLEAWPRRGPAEPVVADAAGPGGDRREFAAVLPFAALAGGLLWDLWLRPAEGAEAVRVARILDDVPDKKRIFTYPAQPVARDAGEPAGAGPVAAGPAAVTAKPYYTLNNDLAVRIDRAE